MPTSKVKYDGNLKTVSTHELSGDKISTAAPKDNEGDGSAFSPTDLCATSLASCMLTVIGIAAKKKHLPPVDGATAEVTKVMAGEPRRISEIHVSIEFPKGNFSEKDRKVYELTALTCPVAKSLHPDIIQKVEFHWR
jgi:putative redox protein